MIVQCVTSARSQGEELRLGGFAPAFSCFLHTASFFHVEQEVTTSRLLRPAALIPCRFVCVVAVVCLSHLSVQLEEIEWRDATLVDNKARVPEEVSGTSKILSGVVHLLTVS